MADIDELPYPQTNQYNTQLLLSFFNLLSTATLNNLIFTNNHDYNYSLCLFNEWAVSFEHVLDRTDLDAES